MARKFLEKFLNLRIRSKFLISYLLIILFTVLMISIVNFKISESTLKASTSRYSEYLMEQLGMNLESRTRDIEDFIFLQFNNSGLNKHMRARGSDDNIEGYQKRRSMDIFLYNLINSKQYIKYAAIIDIYNDRYYKKKDNIDLDFKELFKTLDTEEVKALWGKTLWKQKDGLILMQRALYDSDNTEYLGIIAVGIDSSYFSRLYRNIDKVEGGRIVILDSKNNFIISEDSLSTGITNFLLESGLVKETSMYSNFMYKGKEYIMTVWPSENGMWKILNIITLKELTKNSTILKFWILITCIVAFLIALLIAVLVSRNITENIRLLVKSVKEASEGNFKTKIQPKSYDEIGLLAEEFNNMNEKINRLINTVYHEQILKKNAEYKALQFEYNALQAQINPHFLYNTLDTISSIAKLKGVEEVSEMVCLLGNLFRDSIKKDSSIVCLSDEIQYIRNYLKLQKITYGEKIEVEYDIDDSITHAKIPKFILQPIVENAIVHGVEKKPGKGFIIINCFKNRYDNITIEVIDNGLGIEKDNLKKILDNSDGVDCSEERHTKVGLKSVDKRIKILYGNSYGINISSELNRGTCVRVNLPFVTDESKLHSPIVEVNLDEV